MTVNESQMSFGAFDVKLRGEESIGPDGSPLPATPQEILDLFDEDGFLGHVIITPQWVDPNELDPLDLARYTGVLRETKFAQDGIVVSGSGMVYWLGDQQQRGPIFENTLSLSSQSFVDGITAILPDAITPGNIIAEVGTQSASFLYVTARYALEYWCSLYSAEYEVTPQGTLNAGTPASLYSTFNNPTTFIKRHGAGADPSFKHLPIANASFGRDAVNYATRVIALTQVEDTSFLEGEADLSPPTAKRDIHGNLVAITDVNVETSALATNADARAAARLAQIGEPRQVTSLSTDDYDVDGTMSVGDSVYVWDPASGLFDLANEIQFRGETYWPAKLRIVGLTWPITKEMGVYFRDNTSSGNVYDLTPYVDFEEGNSTQVDVGAFSRSLIPPSTEPLGPIVAPTVNPSSAPSQPSAPSVSSADQILHILVSHDLTKAGGGSLESWTAFLNVFASTSSGFTPGPTNYIGRIEVSEAQITLGTPVLGVFELDNADEHYFKVQAVGNNGLEGPASAQSSATANLIPSAAIIELEAEKIAAGSISVAVELTAAHIIGGIVETAASGQRVALEEGEPDRITFYTGAAAESEPGVLRSDVTGSGATELAYMILESPALTVDASIGSLLLNSSRAGGTTDVTAELVVENHSGDRVGVVDVEDDRIDVVSGEQGAEAIGRLLLNSASATTGGLALLRTQAADGDIQADVVVEDERVVTRVYDASEAVQSYLELLADQFDMTVGPSTTTRGNFYAAVSPAEASMGTINSGGGETSRIECLSDQITLRAGPATSSDTHVFLGSTQAALAYRSTGRRVIVTGSRIELVDSTNSLIATGTDNGLHMWNVLDMQDWEIDDCAQIGRGNAEIDFDTNLELIHGGSIQMEVRSADVSFNEQIAMNGNAIHLGGSGSTARLEGSPNPDLVGSPQVRIRSTDDVQIRVGGFAGDEADCTNNAASTYEVFTADLVDASTRALKIFGDAVPEVLTDIRQTPQPRRYKWRAKPNMPDLFGVAAEDLPAYLCVESSLGRGIKPAAMASWLLQGLQELADRVEGLEGRLSDGSSR